MENSIDSKTKERLIHHIKNGTNVEEEWYSLNKFLNYCGVGQYRRICERRILSEIGLEERNVEVDLVNGGIALSRKGVLKCKDIIEAFINENQMNEFTEMCYMIHRSTVVENNLLWLIRNTSVKDLKDAIKSKELIELGFHELYKQELLTRGHFVRLYRYLVKCIKQRYYNALCGIKHFWKIRYLKRCIKQSIESGEIDSLKIPINTDKAALFCNYFERCKELSPEKRTNDDTMKFIFAGVKYFNKRKAEDIPKQSFYQIEQDYKDMKGIIDAISTLTPEQFTHVFQIDKKFDGDKYGMKDYFFTQKMLNGIPQDKPIGDKRVIEFLEDYTNTELFVFICRWSGLLSDYSVYCGKNEPFEEYVRDLGNRAGGLELR